MKIVTPKQMREMDGLTINEIGIPGIVLMENAALCVVEEVTDFLGSLAGKSVLVLAGKGNNGGDAFAVARHLFNKGAKVAVYLLAHKTDLAGDALINSNIIEKMGIVIHELIDKSNLRKVIQESSDSDIIIDGIFGTGLKGVIDGIVKSVIEAVNDSGTPVISIDIPSGINGSTGEVCGICVKAARTVTFCLPKTGLVIHPGCEYAGELRVVDIGIPSCVIERMEINTGLTEYGYVSEIIPSRFINSNKGDYGKVLVVTGSTGMTGSGCLAAKAALRAGAGLVYLGVPSSLANVYDSAVLEAVTIPLDDGGKGHLAKGCIAHIAERMKGMDAIAVGPGLSVSDDVFDVVCSILENAGVPVILDADALNAISRDVSVLKMLKAGGVVTPHPGEMARLLGVSIQEVQKNRLETAMRFSSTWGVVTVLKGSRTVIAAPDGTVLINPTGNPGMATGGTGDVLTGIIASLIGQGVTGFDAAAAGVYLHGECGDSAAALKGRHGLIAGDLIEQLPYVIRKMTEI